MYMQINANTHTNMHRGTQAHAHTHTRAHMHTRTHTGIKIGNLIFVSDKGWDNAEVIAVGAVLKRLSALYS